MTTTPASPHHAAIPTSASPGGERRARSESHWLKSLAVLFCLMNSAQAATFGKFTYTDNGGDITITDYPTTEVGAVEIPASITSKPVASIGDLAFYGCTNLAAAIFLGNAPAIFDSPFERTAPITIYYLVGNQGFSTPVWNGYPAFPGVPTRITSAAPPSTGKVGVPYHHTFTATGTPPPAFAVSVGALPDGLALSSAGVISGTPTAAGVFTGTITASNGFPPAVTQDFAIDTNEYRILATSGIHGTVTGGTSYVLNTTATLTAAPALGYIFSGWSGDATGAANPLSVLMEADKTITANFVPDTSDTDGDGLTQFDEVAIYGTNPELADTDGDGLTDGWETGVGRFSIIAGTFTWAQARADAHRRRGELACFPTGGRWNRAMELLGAAALDSYAGLWIGASDAAAEGTWTWVNGEPFAFSQWATGRPSAVSGNTLDYAEVSGGDSSGEIGKWYDRSPSSMRDGYILETGYATDPNTADTDNDGFGDGFEVNAGFNPILAASTPEGLAALSTVPGSIPVAVEFRFNAASGVSYRIEGSTDLNEWTTVEPDLIGAGGVITRLFSTENQPQRYFRARRN